MKLLRFHLWIVLLASLPFATLSQNQNENSGYVPEEGQDGKDVIWWPTPNSLVNAMLDMANVGADDFVVDLGSGDGRIVIEAAKRGANAVGIEYNPDLVKFAEQRAAKEGVSDKAKFLNMDLFEYDLSKATVITMYLLTDLNLRLRPSLLELKPGTRIVSNTFDLGDWKADQEIHPDTNKDNSDGEYRMYSRSLGYYWVVPAKVEGTWKFRDGKLNLVQTYQMLEGTFETGNEKYTLEAAKLLGNEITFTINGVVYKGSVSGDQMNGLYPDGGKEIKWKASR
jgi:SAM-dependent methyltransferase